MFILSFILVVSAPVPSGLERFSVAFSISQISTSPALTLARHFILSPFFPFPFLPSRFLPFHFDFPNFFLLHIHSSFSSSFRLLSIRPFTLTSLAVHNFFPFSPFFLSISYFALPFPSFFSCPSSPRLCLFPFLSPFHSFPFPPFFSLPLFFFFPSWNGGSGCGMLSVLQRRLATLLRSTSSSTSSST